jgi:1-acyl-sn-glycerol-3-phosphate acyltransferase
MRDVAGVDITAVQRWWSAWFGLGRWPIEDLYFGLIRRFVRSVNFADPAAWDAVRGRPHLYLANHQVAIESLLFDVVLGGHNGVITSTIAKAEHRETWLGYLIGHGFAYPGCRDPGVIRFLDRGDKAALGAMMMQLGMEMATGKTSVLVHVEGTRSTAANRPVQKMSSAILEMSLQTGAPVVPVRFSGGLPVDDAGVRLSFPVGLGSQDVWIGRPIPADELRALSADDRKAQVMAAMNALGPEDEVPNDPDPVFAADVAEWCARTGAEPDHAVLFRTILDLPDPHPMVIRLLEGVERGVLRLGTSPEDEWLALLAERAYGPTGPRIER